MATATTVVQPTDAYINAVVGANRWVGTITFSFPNLATDYESPYSDDNEPNTFLQLNATQQTVARHIFGANSFGMFASVANVNFTENVGASDATADIRMAYSDAPAPTAWAYGPFNHPTGGDAWFTKSSYNTPTRGDYAYATFIHELGHSMGLDHAHVNGMPAARDSLEFTVMTYRSYVGHSGTGGYTNPGGGNYPTTLMMYDIAALQYMYGADFTTQSGNTTYSWGPTSGETFINGVGQGATVGNKIFVTVWDGGGNDTYDFQTYSTGLYIDLSPGGWVTLASAQLANLGHQENGGVDRFARGNVFNALLYNGDTRSLIENANGGSGGDIFWDNIGGNWFQGFNGNDQFNYWAGGFDWYYGGQGTDSARFTLLTLPVWVDLGASGGVQAWRNNGGSYTDIANLVDVEDVVGTNQGDYLRGGSGNNWLQGGNGNDTLAYFGGFDWLYGDVGTDTASFATISQPIWVDLALASNNAYTRGATLNSGTWTAVSSFNSIEDLIGTGYGDYLKGGAGNNWIQGGGGDDTLVYFGGFDWLYGDAGSDNASFEVLGIPIYVDLAAATQHAWTRGATLNSGTWTWVSNFASIENVFGTPYDDFLKGDANSNWIVGGNGNDTLQGGLGLDWLDGGAGADTYQYLSLAEAGSSVWDIIMGFQTGVDKIDVSSIDANVNVGGTQDFFFNGSTNGGTGSAWYNSGYVGFNNGSGTLYWLQVSTVGGGDFFF